jgi:uncharacterized membrane protein YraQ (UPF0718 family)
MRTLNCLEAMHQNLVATSNPTATSRLIKPRERLLKSLIYLSVGVLLVDSVYSYCNGITLLTRDRCILYQMLGHWGFLLYEYFVELFVLVLVGVFVASLIERHLLHLKRFLPRNPLLAFGYGSVLPLCACGAIPLAGAMSGRVPLRCVITFLVAAPILNPYIMALSVSVLGWPYAFLRIGGALVLAVACGYGVELLSSRFSLAPARLPSGCPLAVGCKRSAGSVYEMTWAVFKKVLPFLLVAALMGLALEWIQPEDWVDRYQLGDSFLGTLLVVLAGVPVYFCNGADVLFLKPLVAHRILPVGTALAISLTATSVCVTSVVLLTRFLGRRLAAALVACVIVISLVLAYVTNMASRCMHM